jgi:hypothetical protein
MIKTLSVLFLSLLISGSAYSEKYFKYESVVGCGPKKIMSIGDLPSYESWQYYLIHVANSGNVVIYNDGYQYATFEKKSYSQLWNQNQKTTSLKLRKDEVTNTYQFELISEFDELNREEDKKLINYFNLNTESMTFAYRRVGYPSQKKYEPSTGICWRIV